MKRIFLGIFAILFLLSIQNVFAQEQIVDVAAEADPINDDNGWGDSINSVQNGVNCFDYYTFQSVQVSVNADRAVSQYGDTILFSGNITNENAQPVVDGNVYVRISEYNEEFYTEGHYVVDEFFALENVNLSAGEVKDVAFEWVVPEHLSKGIYNIDLFFSVGKKFNLGGLPFSNEIIGGSSSFELDSVKEGYFSFDRAATQFNGEKYHHIGNWPVIEKGTDSTFTYYLKNTFDHDVQATVIFDTYNWDSLDEQDLIKTENIIVDVPANTSKEINYVVSDSGQSVYYVQATATFNDTKTIVNTRFSIEDGEMPRLNYPAITKFPVNEGDELTLFTCFHNTTNTNTEGEVELKLFDAQDNIIKVVTHVGIIPSAMSAIKEDIVAERDYDYLKLQATVKNTNGDVVDEYEAVYSCEQFNNCDENVGIISNDVRNNNMMKIFAYVIIIIMVILIIVVIIKIIKNKKGLVSIFFMVVVTGAMFMSVDQVIAASVTSSKSYTHGHLKSGIFRATFASGSVSANHIINGATSMVCDGSINYRYAPTLTFNARGGSWDTPYGRFCSNYTSASCFGSNIVRSGQRITSSAGNTGYIYWTGRTPAVTLTSSNTNILRCSGLRCTAVSGQSGRVRVTARFAATPVKVWSAIQMRVTKGGSLRGIPSEGFWGTPRRYTNNHGQVHFYLKGSDGSIGVASGRLVHGYSSTIGGSKTNTMSLPAKSVFWDVTIGSCVSDGKCGSRHTPNAPYLAETKAYPARTNWCDPIGSESNFSEGPYFPAQGTTKTWDCKGVNGGKTVSCEASREAPPRIDGNCKLQTTPVSQFDSKPAQTNLILCNKGTATIIQGDGSAESPWTWDCIGSGPSHTDQTECTAQMNPGRCDSTSPLSYDYPDSDWIGTETFCEFGTPVSNNPPTFPEIDLNNPIVITEPWKCNTLGGDSAICSATNNPPTVSCGTPDGLSNINDKPTTPTYTLCNNSSTTNVLLDTDGKWNWDCTHTILTNLTVPCSADSCLADQPFDLQRYVYFDTEGEPQKATIGVNGPGVCCRVESQDLNAGGAQSNTVCTGQTGEVTLTTTGSTQYDVRCWFDDGDENPDNPVVTYDDIPVDTMCTARECNAQGACQATPQTGGSMNACKSTCNSNADCSRGRIIETRP